MRGASARLLLLLIVAAATFHRADASEGWEIIYIEYRFVAPTIEPGSFEASTRKVWRSGDRYLRIEEAPDPKQGIHGVMIVNEPDSWLWNRLNNVARHIVDPGPTFIVRFPIFLAESLKKLQGLELGRERDFFSAHGATVIPDQILDGVECTVQSLQVDDSTLVLYLRKSDGSPFQLSINNPRNSHAVRFERYEVRSQFEPSLFAAPEGARIIEAK